MAKNKDKGAAAPASDQENAPVTEAAATTENAAPATEAAATTKSIVDRKYAGKYKAGQRDALGTFIDEQCVGKEGFEYPAFFNLCRINGVAEAQVDKYEKIVADKAHGGQGRARMTLRNMLATIARKNGKLKAQDGTEHEVKVEKQAVSGAAAKAKEDSAAKAGENAAGASA